MIDAIQVQKELVKMYDAEVESPVKIIKRDKTMVNTLANQQRPVQSCSFFL